MARRRLNANHVPVPDPDLTPRAMAERAAAMRPALRQRQAATEAARRILGETNDEFVRAGFYRILQPRRFGGYEFDLPTFVRVAMEVSRGCPSSGWVVTFTAGHTHVFAKFPEQAQAEAYGSDGEFRAPFVGNALNPSVQEVDGGYRVSGAWDYASGCDTATHFFGAVFLPLAQPAGPSGGSLLFLFDRNDFEIIDNWDMLGMRGTGSKRVRVKDVFVPAHRVNRRDWLERSDEPDILRPFDRAQGRQAQDAAPGYGLFANPMYAGPSGNVLMAEIAAVAVGTGFCALDAYEEILKTRVLRGPSGTSRAESPEYQRNYGHAHALLATAGAALIGCAEEYMEACRLEVEEGVRFDSEKSQHLTLIGSRSRAWPARRSISSSAPPAPPPRAPAPCWSAASATWSRCARTRRCSSTATSRASAASTSGSGPALPSPPHPPRRSARPSTPCPRARRERIRS